MLIYVQAIDRRDDKDLFAEIYMAYRRPMYSVARRYLKQQQDAEDAVHQAFLYMAENFSKFSAGVCPKTWSYIVKLVESRAIDILRQKAKCDTSEIYEQQLVSIPVPESASYLTELILGLPERYRTALILRYTYGYEYSEIGRFLHISEATAQKLVSRARRKLEKICKEEGVL
jgi:RNA polymerase sigma-70 factor (ECF subfamily)